MQDKNKWQKKVAYQIYPRSFYDKNNDGTGDIAGITAKLDYLSGLGVDVIWICPVYRSPMDDGGYDISDYSSIDPLFGNMDDMDELIAQSKKRGMIILMDLVINHCSDEHEWFKKALADRNSEEAGYFYFRDQKDGLPNNWRSMFGGSAWEKTNDGRYYLHLFSKKQPDLNWENPKLRQKLYDMINKWLSKGIGGFRIDAITHIKKDPSFSSLPADGEDGLVGCFASTRNFPGIGEFLTELKESTFEKYGCLTVAEAAGVPYEDLGAYIGENGYFTTLFDFSYSELYSYGHGWHTCKKAGEWDIMRLRDGIFASQTETQKVGFGAVFFENHDYPRAITKYVPDEYHSPEAQKMLGILYFFLRGIPFIYQGQELGMTNTRFESIDDVDDVSTKNHYRLALADGLSEKEALLAVNRYSRDNARVPFPWDSSENGGFSKATPWKKPHPDYKLFCAENEIKDENSVYHFYKKMIALRKSSEYSHILCNGGFSPLYLENGVIAYERTDGDGIAVICSLSPAEMTVSLPFEVESTLLSCGNARIENAKAVLPPYSALLLHEKPKKEQKKD